MKNATFFAAVSIKRAVLVGAALCALAACDCLPQMGAGSAQNAYPTPDRAVGALLTASRADDKPALLAILGPQAERLVYSGDPVADRAGQQKFIAAYDSYHRLEAEGADKRVLVVGREEWPLPIPLVHAEQGWMFDTAAGEQAIIDRRIGRNELDVIEICREYVAAQRDYAALHKQAYGYPAFAQRITSSAGSHDGLYWPAGPRQTQSPFGPLMADAQAEGYDRISGHHAPYHGYYFRVLKQQGPSAAGGARDYLVDGRMTRGFGLIAYPAVYGDSGVKTFIVNQNGIVYERDLGPETESAAAQIRSYDPDEGWRTVR